MGHTFKRGLIYWIAYSNGKPTPYYKVIRESTRQDDRKEAERLLKLREGEIASGLPVIEGVNKIRLDDLLKDVVTDYRMNGYRSINMLELRIKKHISPHLGGWRIAEMRPSDIMNYATDRLNEGAAPATINRELSIIKRAFALGLYCRRIREAPYVRRLKENNVREGFFEAAEFETLCKHLPYHIEPLIRFLYLTGWRVSEAKQLKWKDVNWDGKVVYLWQSGSKNREGRTFPLISVLDELLTNQQKLAKELCPYVFHCDGTPIGSFNKSWKTATVKAGLAGRLVHDLRRTAVRNFVRAGIPEHICMLLTGHKTREIFDRYDIVSKQDIQDAAEKMNQPLIKEGKK